MCGVVWCGVDVTFPFTHRCSGRTSSCEAYVNVQRSVLHTPDTGVTHVVTHHHKAPPTHAPHPRRHHVPLPIPPMTHVQWVCVGTALGDRNTLPHFTQPPHGGGQGDVLRARLPPQSHNRHQPRDCVQRPCVPQWGHMSVRVVVSVWLPRCLRVLPCSSSRATPTRSHSTACGWV